MLKLKINFVGSGTFSEEHKAMWLLLSDEEQAERIQSSKEAIIKMAIDDMNCTEVDVIVDIVEE